MKTIFILPLAILAIIIAGCTFNPPAPGPGKPQDVDRLGLSLPQGFSISVFADVPGARSMALGDGGTIFVGTRGDKVYAVKDTNGDYSADDVKVIASGLRTPNGVAFRNGDLYVAEISRILKFHDIENTLDNPEYEIVNDNFPSNTQHGWKYIAFGPDGKLYVPVGAPCNICDEEGFAAIYRINPDGSGKELFARGIRNTVGFDWSPESGELYFTDNGRDSLGDNMPPDELNRAGASGMHFGYPYCHGSGIADPQFGPKENDGCPKYTEPVRDLGPHVAALGMKFYNGTMFPEEYQNQVFIAEHGSWNRAEKIGYRVSLVKPGNGEASYEPFISGWLKDESVSGRPVDILLMPDGSMLVSDDYSGRIYRVAYSEQ